MPLRLRQPAPRIRHRHCRLQQRIQLDPWSHNLIGHDFGEIIDVRAATGVNPVGATGLLRDAVNVRRTTAAFYDAYAQGGLTNAGGKA